MRSGRIFTVDAPETGFWRFEVTGTGDFSVSVKANSSIQFSTFTFVELIESRHTGLFPIDGQPLAGSQTALATLLGPFGSAQFELLSSSGDFSTTLNLTQGGPNAADSQFVGTVALPTEAFRVSVSGADTAGQAYQRLYPVLFRARTIGVTVDSGVIMEQIPAGETTTVKFIVTNIGDPATFEMVVTDNLGFVSRVAQSSLTLDTGASGVVDVDVTVPVGTPGGTSVSVIATAISTGDPDVNNSATLELVVNDLNSPPDCDSASSSAVELSPPDHMFVEIDLLDATGISDPDGDPVMVTVGGITQDEPVDADDGDGVTSPDGAGIGSGVASVRAERAGGGNGRVYQVSFTASDDKGASCEGSLLVTVPLSQGGGPAVDDGQIFDSTQE